MINRIQAGFRQVDLEKHSSMNWELIKKGPQCGCYYCAQVFPSSAVRDYEENENGEKGALCPNCGRKTLVTPDMIVAGTPFTAEAMRGIREAICELEVRHTRLSDMLKKDKWAYDHWHDYIIEFWVEEALKPISQYVELCVERKLVPAEAFSAEALKTIASEVADRHLQQYVAEGSDNSFVPLMHADIQRAILRKALDYQE
jgi:hypothetical protein